VKRPSADTTLTYGQAGTGSIIPAVNSVFTLGVAVQNRGKRDVVVQSFEVIHQEGVAATIELVVGPKRKIGQLASSVGFPPDPKNLWEPSAPRRFGNGFDLPPGKQSADWGYNVLIRVQRTARYGFIRGYRVRGAVDGKPFVDEVDVYVAMCGDANNVTADCDRYSKVHGYS